jgi:hypothetical protein
MKDGAMKPLVNQYFRGGEFLYDRSLRLARSLANRASKATKDMEPDITYSGVRRQSTVYKRK